MIGAIADDFTGATDVAVAFRRGGLTTAVAFGIPGESAEFPAVDALVVALKTRTVAAAEAVRASLDAADRLSRLGADRFYFKYCSTFDSRADGNIGPVADALADRVGAEIVVVVPASPEHARTQYLGYLFAGDVLLEQSSMRTHPLTPMTDSFVPRLLGPQTRHGVGLVDLRTVRAGTAAVIARLRELGSGGVRYAVVDALTDDDLAVIGAAVRDARLVTGAAGLAGGWARARATGTPIPDSSSRFGVDGRAAVLAGSCSARTLQQLALFTQDHPGHLLDARAIPDASGLAAAALDWFDGLPADSTPVIYSSLPPAELRATQEQLGVERASSILEAAAGLVARGLVERGVRRLVVAGGETSGAVVTALQVAGGIVGAEEAPGVPWIHTLGDEPLALLLKSGNFGDVELLRRAVGVRAA